jgi:hypothetical protein
MIKLCLDNRDIGNIGKESKMVGLKICLWITGVLCFLAVVGLFLPMSAFETVVKFFGVEELPDLPLLNYAMRTGAATFVGIGVYFFILAMNPVKYGVLIPFSGLASIFIGVVCFITGATVKMPVMWYLGDSLSCIILGVLILAFQQKAKRTIA